MEVGSVWLGHGLLIAGCAVGALPLVTFLPGVPRGDRQRRWAVQAGLLASALLVGAMGLFRIHNADQSHLEASEVLLAALLIQGLLLGCGSSRPDLLRLSLIGFGVACLLSLPTALVAPTGIWRMVIAEAGPGALADFPAAWILGYASPIDIALAAGGCLLAAFQARAARRKGVFK